MSDATQRLRIGVVGCGCWGKNLVRVVQDAGCLVAVSDSDPDCARQNAQEFAVPALGFEEILETKEIDAVVIATPAEFHSQMTSDALQAGKHVFVEKPLALRAQEAQSLILSAREASVTLMVGHLLQYHPIFIELRRLVAAGKLGRLQYVYSQRLNLGKIRRSEDVFWSFAPHDISMILSLAGEEPERVDATGASYLQKTIADVTTTHLSFPSGIHAHVFVSWLHPFKEQKLVAIGETGMAVFDDTLPWDEKLKLYPHYVGWHNGMPEPVKGEAIPVKVDEAEPLCCEIEHFIECVLAGETPRTDGEEGLRVLRVLDAAAHFATGADATPKAIGATGLSIRSEIPPDAFVHPSSYIDEGCQIGSGTKIWHFSHVLGGTRIGRDCVLGQNVMVGPDVTVGDNCKIQNNVSLYRGVHLEDSVFCGPSCVFTNVSNPRAEIERKGEFKETRVGRGATIGANATIICGNPVGEYAFIAAGAVITKQVPAHAMMAGVPAERIGWMSPSGDRLGSDLVCPRTGRMFEETDSGMLVERPTRKAEE